MKALLRTLLLSLMLGLLEAMRRLESSDGDRFEARWVMRVPLPSPLDRPERCWFWGGSALAN
ncbi:MAG: hypothetical protein IPM12_11120 [Flavobacteriales bacterium]|nr:hypothetical protein [Flavobacteriales bacterium]